MPSLEEFVTMVAAFAAFAYVVNWMWAIRQHLSSIATLLADIRDEVRQK